MAEILFLLFLAVVLLALLPQLAGLGVGALAQRRGSWWPVLLGVAIPPILFALAAGSLYGSESATWLQGDAHGKGRIEVSNLQLGVMIHAGLALLIQIAQLVRGR